MRAKLSERTYDKEKTLFDRPQVFGSRPLFILDDLSQAGFVRKERIDRGGIAHPIMAQVNDVPRDRRVCLRQLAGRDGDVTSIAVDSPADLHNGRVHRFLGLRQDFARRARRLIDQGLGRVQSIEEVVLLCDLSYQGVELGRS